MPEINAIQCDGRGCTTVMNKNSEDYLVFYGCLKRGVSTDIIKTPETEPKYYCYPCFNRMTAPPAKVNYREVEKQAEDTRWQRKPPTMPPYRGERPDITFQVSTVEGAYEAWAQEHNVLPEDGARAYFEKHHGNMMDAMADRLHQFPTLEGDHY